MAGGRRRGLRRGEQAELAEVRPRGRAPGRLSTSRIPPKRFAWRTSPQAHRRSSHAIAAVSRSYPGTRAGSRTQASVPLFIFLGPSGVGKTESARLSPSSCSATRTRDQLDSRVHGEHRSAVWSARLRLRRYEEGGQLPRHASRRTRRQLDEIEKAPRTCFNTLCRPRGLSPDRRQARRSIQETVSS